METPNTQVQNATVQAPPREMSSRAAFGLIAAALFFDACSVLPLVNGLVVVVGQLTMAWLFSRAGVNLFQGRPAVAYVVATVVEAMPAASIMPLFTVETVAIIFWARRQARKAIR